MSTVSSEAEDKLARFRGDTGQIVRARSPLRISFAGGGTDIPAYYEEKKGAVLSSTINRYAYVTLYPRDEDREAGHAKTSDRQGLAAIASNHPFSESYNCPPRIT